MRAARALAPLALLAAVALARGAPEERPGPYLDGRLPRTAPRETDHWRLVPAFPELTFKDAVGLVAAPRSNRLYVHCRQGQVWSFENDATTREKKLFLDVTARCQGWDDSGLLGMAFHPDFGRAGSPNRGFVYVWYMHSDHPKVTPRGRPDFAPPDMTDRLSRFTVPEGKDAVDPDSELVLIDQRDRHLWHNGGGMFFDSDGFLYISNGDEGAAFGNEQRIDRNLFSGILRIDVDEDARRSHPIKTRPGTGKTDHYFIPNDNPWVGVAGALEEFWAIGLRNPHRVTYDAVEHRVWCGDVGDGTREEVDVIERGGNYQWRYKEGTLDHDRRPARVLGDEKPPLWEYDHRTGAVCVIGGYVYRGKEQPELRGKYVFGDLTGPIWALDWRPGAPPVVTRIATLPMPETTSYGAGLASFGVDQNGELYAVQIGDAGKLWKLVKRDRAPARPPRLLSELRAFDDVRAQKPRAGVVPYEVNAPLWSDGAAKRRWVAAPAPARFHEREPWRFANGTVFVKTFERDGRRLETRVLVTGDEVYGLSYKWRADGSDAELLEDGMKLALPDGTTWTYPSRDDCLRCHTPQAGWVLGGKSRQLARGDQLAALRDARVVDMPAAVDPAKVARLADPRDQTAPIESRARAWLEANCAHCHIPSGPGRAWFDARATTPLLEAGLVHGPAIDALWIKNAKLIAPGDPDRSLLLARIHSADKRMPPLAVTRTDDDGAAVVSEWIRTMERYPEPAPSGLRGEYFSGVNLDRKLMERIDPTVDFDWGDGSPDKRVPADDFSVRWRGWVTVPATGTWTFSTVTDDGARLWVDGVQLVDKWIDQGATEWSGTLPLEAGRRVTIELEYYERGGAASARLVWSGPDTEKEPIPPRYLTPAPMRKWR